MLYEVITISESDTELLNRVKAAEYLAMVLHISPVDIITNAIYSTSDGVEVLEILNSVVLLQDVFHYYQFNIQKDYLYAEVLNEPLVKERLKYLESIV